jgi:hypothetical protein
MEQLSEDQRQQMLRKRQEMLKKMGVSNAGQMMNESVVDTGKSSSSMAQKLAAIKNGSAKAELNKYINATAKGESGAGGFSGIPESKPRKNNEEVKPEYKQQLDKFDMPSSSHSEMGELSAIESLFGGDGPRMSTGNGSQMLAQNPVNMELNLDSAVMPSFNPQAALQQKVRAKAQSQPQENSYLKFASDTPPVQNEQFVEVGAQPQFNMNQLQMMMETIAKGIAEKTIKNVLSEYSEQQKGKNYFEYYNKEKGIIKTPDGKYYKLTQVELRKKQ